MSASPTSAVASTKRPLEDPSSPAGPNDLPDAKRQALDKTITESNTAQDDVKRAVDGLSTAEAPVNADPTVEAANNSAAATNGSAEVEQHALPIPSTTSTNNQVAQPPPTSMPTQDESQWLHVRSVISSSEAATVIGKGGENVSQIRRMSGAKCTVSDYSKGAVERILTVSGAQDAVAKVKISTLKLYRAFTDLSLGFWPHHPNSQQRVPRSSINSSIENISSTSTSASYPHWLHHRQVRCSHQRDSRSIWCTTQRFRRVLASIHRAISCRARCR